jgi:ectoine hydroxylase-related dioxygenase (phytanoyl-CoA dioxygenase family)
VSWHQDATYFGLEPAVHVTAWVALTDAPAEAGCMEVVPGSHRRGQQHHGQFDAPDNLLSRGQTLTVDFARESSVFMALKAGQMSLHHAHLIHRSGPNLSSDRRIGFGISYIPTPATCRASVRCWCPGPTAMGISTTSPSRRAIGALPSRKPMPRPSPASARKMPRKSRATRRRNDTPAGFGAARLPDRRRLHRG